MSTLLPIVPTPSSSSQLISSLSRHIHDLQSFQLPRLRACNTLTLQRELAGELRSDMESMKKGLDELELLADDEENPQGRESIESEHRRLKASLEKIRSDYREALIHSSNQIKNSNRMELLPPSDRNGDQVSTPKRTHNESTSSRGADGDELQTKTNEVTDALRRTTQLMQIELEKSVMATQMLDESSHTLRSTHTLYDTYTSLLTTSTKLVHQIEQADWYDRFIIFAALAFFLLCVGFIVKRRVLDKGLGAVGWWLGGSWRLITGQWRTKGEVVRSMVESKGAGVATKVMEVAKGGDVATTVLDGVVDLATAVATSPGAKVVGEVIRQRVEL